MEYTTPPSYGSTVVSVGGIATDGEIVCAGSGHSAQHTEIKEDPDNEWPEPGAVKFLWNGNTKDGKPVRAELVGSLGKRLDKVDVMAKVPGFVKTIVGGVAGTKPYIYQVCISTIFAENQILCLQVLQYSPQQKLALKITIGEIERVEEGNLFSEATFIS